MARKNKNCVNVFKPLKNTYFFLLGFFLCQDIFDIFTYGSTSFNIAFLWILPAIIAFVVKERKNLLNHFFSIPTAFVFFFASIILSCFIGIFYITNFSNFATIIKSFIYFIIASTCPFLAGLFFFKKKNIILSGVLLGFILNFILSLLAFLSFEIIGFPLTLKYLFGNNYFYAPNYFFRSQGLFLEPSYMSCFVLATFYLLMWHFKKTYIRILIEIMALFLFLTSGSGNFLIFLISQFIYLIFLMNNGLWKNLTTKVFKTRILKIIFSLSIITALSVFVVLLIFPLKNKFLSLLDGINPSSEENSERFYAMQLGLLLFIKNPWGVGFGLSGTILLRTYENLLVGTTFNYLIKVLSEQGVLGGIFYCGIFYCGIKAMFKNAIEKENRILAISIISIFVVSFLTGSFETISWFVLGVTFAVVQQDNFIGKMYKQKRNKEKYYTINI